MCVTNQAKSVSIERIKKKQKRQQSLLLFCFFLTENFCGRDAIKKSGDDGQHVLILVCGVCGAAV